jgi:hypothetical protein
MTNLFRLVTHKRLRPPSSHASPCGILRPVSGCTLIAHFLLHRTIMASWLCGVPLGLRQSPSCTQSCSNLISIRPNTVRQFWQHILSMKKLVALLSLAAGVRQFPRSRKTTTTIMLTILKALGLNPWELDAVRAEGTRVFSRSNSSDPPARAGSTTDAPSRGVRLFVPSDVPRVAQLVCLRSVVGLPTLGRHRRSRRQLRAWLTRQLTAHCRLSKSGFVRCLSC